MSGVDDDIASSVWIVHRESSRRAALARLSAASENTLLGGPGDPLFESAPQPDVVVLGLAEDFERELEFAHRTARRFAGCAWILIVENEETLEARRLFEDLPAQILSDPPPAAELQRAIRQRLRSHSAQSLSKRRKRDRLSERFARCFGDADVPGLLRALDPRLAPLPLLVRGESGSGRALIARYVHAFGSDVARPFVHIDCEGVTREAELTLQLEDVPQEASLFFEDVDALPARLQRRVRDWIDFGLPDPVAVKEPFRFMASAWEDRDYDGRRLDSQLSQLLSVLCVHTVSLRAQPDRIVQFAQDTARAWDRTSGRASRSFSSESLEILRSHLWPGNLRELEAVVVRSLASTMADPIEPVGLRFDAVGEWGSVDPAPVAAERSADSTPPPREVPEQEELAPQGPRTQLDDEIDFDAEALALEQLGPPPPPEVAATASKDVDLAELLDGLLDELRDSIQSRRLLVLKELDRAEPTVLGDAEVLRRALSGLLAHALSSVPERGDLYLASNHHPAGLGGKPCVRVLLRYRKPEPEGHPFALKPRTVAATDAGAEVFAATEAVVRELGGAFTGDSADPREAVIVLDLPAPSPK